jgi:hypothetical protein
MSTLFYYLTQVAILVGYPFGQLRVFILKESYSGSFIGSNDIWAALFGFMTVYLILITIISFFIKNRAHRYVFVFILAFPILFFIELFSGSWKDFLFDLSFILIINLVYEFIVKFRHRLAKK